MTSSKPYLIRALYEWIVDNNLTPYLVVNADMPGVKVPREYVEEGRIVLNISPQACRGLHLENDRVVLTARFGQTATQIVATPAAVMAIYAKENGRGMVFGEDDEHEEGDIGTPDSSGNNGQQVVSSDGKGGGSDARPPDKGRPNLKVIK